MLGLEKLPRPTCLWLIIWNHLLTTCKWTTKTEVNHTGQILCTSLSTARHIKLQNHLNRIHLTTWSRIKCFNMLHSTHLKKVNDRWKKFIDTYQSGKVKKTPVFMNNHKIWCVHTAHFVIVKCSQSDQFSLSLADVLYTSES